MKKLITLIFLLFLQTFCYSTFTIIKNKDPVDAPTAMNNWRHVNFGNTLKAVNSNGSEVNNTIDLGSVTGYFKESYITTMNLGVNKIADGSLIGDWSFNNYDLTNIAELGGTLQIAAQPNITSLGTLTSLDIIGNLTVDTDVLYVNTSSNKVGINRSPSNELEVYNALDSAQFMIESDYSTGFARMQTRNNIDTTISLLGHGNASSASYDSISLANSAELKTNADNFIIHASANKPLYFGTNSNVRMKIAGDGVSTFFENLIADKNLIVSENLTVQTDLVVDEKVSVSGNLIVGTSADVLYVNTSSNKVGINRSPSNELEVYNSSNSAQFMTESDSSTSFARMQTRNNIDTTADFLCYGNGSSASYDSISLANSVELKTNADNFIIHASGDKPLFFGTNSNVRMKIASDGVTINESLAVPNQPRCRAYRSSSFQSITTDVDTNIQFNAEAYDNDSMHDNSTNPDRFTVQESGIYLLSANITSELGTGNIVIRINRYNSSSVFQRELAEILIPSNVITINLIAVSGFDEFAVGDYAVITFLQNSGSDKDIIFGENITYASIVKLH